MQTFMKVFFTLYRDADKGNVYIEISEDQLNKEYIHFSYIENGVTDAGFLEVIFVVLRSLKFKNITIELNLFKRIQPIILMKKVPCLNHLMPM